MLGLRVLAERKRYSANARRFWRNIAAAASLEYAFTAPLMITGVVGVMEVGNIVFVNSLMEGAAGEAARYGLTGQHTEAQRLDNIQTIIGAKTIGLVDLGTAQITTRHYDMFDEIGEPYTDDNPANGQYDAGEDFIDINNNGAFDADAGAPGVGGPGEIVVYRIQYDLPLLTGLLSNMIGQDGKMKVEATIPVVNEPFLVVAP